MPPVVLPPSRLMLLWRLMLPGSVRSAGALCASTAPLRDEVGGVGVLTPNSLRPDSLLNISDVTGCWAGPTPNGNFGDAADFGTAFEIDVDCCCTEREVDGDSRDGCELPPDEIDDLGLSFSLLSASDRAECCVEGALHIDRPADEVTRDGAAGDGAVGDWAVGDWAAGDGRVTALGNEVGRPRSVSLL